MTLGDRWSFRGIPRGTHVEVQVRHGAPGSRALLGTLTMDGSEWWTFARAMQSLRADVADDTGAVR